MKYILTFALLLTCLLGLKAQAGIHTSQLDSNFVKKRYIIQLRGQGGTLYDFIDGTPIPSFLIGAKLVEVKVQRNDFTTGGSAITGQVRIVSNPNATTWTQSFNITSASVGSNIVTYTPNTVITSTMQYLELTSTSSDSQSINVILVFQL